MKTMIMLIVVAVILCCISGCGPGQPFEIESSHTPLPMTPTHVVAVK